MLFAHKLNVVKSVYALALLTISLLSAGQLQAGEIRWVSDQLTLKMYQDSTLSQVLPSLKTGDRVEILKRDDSYAKVKLDDGTVGWVKSNYLEKLKPAAMRLTEVQKELDELRSKHTDLLIEKPAAIQTTDKQLQARVDAAETSQQNMKLRLQELESERMAHTAELRELNQQQSPKDHSKNVLLWIILPILTLISGFFVGFKYLEGKVKTRFGGYNPL